MTLGEKLSRLRKEYNYTQEQLADILGVSRQSVSKWESDIAYPETDKLIKMGKLFECSMDYLLNEENSQRQGVQPTEQESV
ncbi:MAG: helix-turn-helix transcriptional regulator, partial [Clostridia bacterium]|nr:helix-turn-helix transcriptional regulator [Clostridia bacterium]